MTHFRVFCGCCLLFVSLVASCCLLLLLVASSIQAASRDRDVMDTVVAAHQYVKCLQRKVDHLASASAELQHMQHSVEEIHRAAHSLHATTTISSHATPGELLLCESVVSCPPPLTICGVRVLSPDPAELSTECAAEKAASPTSSLVRETSPTPAPEATATDGFLYRIFCKLFGGVGSSRVGTAEVQMEESCDVPAPVLRDPVELLESYIPRPVPGMTPRLVPMESYYPLVVQPPPPPPPPPSSLCSGTRMQESVLCGVHGGGRASDDEDMEEDRTSFGALSIPWTSTISFEAPPGQHQRLPFTVLGASCSSSSVTQSSNGSTCFSSRRNSECSISDGHSPYHSSRPAASTPIVVTASCSSCGFVHSNTPPSTLPPSRWPLGRPHLSGRVHRRRSWLLQVLHPMFNVLGSLWRRLVLCQHCEEIGGSGSPACRPAAAAATTTTTTTTTTTITTTSSSSSPTSTTSAAAGVPCCGEVSHSSGSWGAKRLSSCRFVGGPFFQSQHRRLFAGSSMPWQSPPLSSAAAAPAAATTSPTKGHFRQHPPPRTNRSPHSRRLPSSLDTVEGVGFLDSLFQMDLDDGQGPPPLSLLCGGCGLFPVVSTLSSPVTGWLLPPQISFCTMTPPV